MTTVVRSALALAIAFGVPVAARASAPAAGPVGTAFYTPPSPLPAATHGDVIWSRPLTGPPALPHAASNTLVLYHTTAVDGRDVAVSGSIAIPLGTPPAGGWPTISWAHGTTGNAPNCAPSRFDERDTEQSDLDNWLQHGFAVVATDYEGQGTPGLHPYFVGEAAAHDVTDIVRAARELYPQIGTGWFAVGHSEGGSASLFTGQFGPAWAPELHLLGVVSYAPGSHLEGLFRSLPRMTTPTQSVAFLLEMVEGIASTDPAIDLRTLLTPDALQRIPELQQRCIDDVMNDRDFVSMPPSGILKAGAKTGPLLADFVTNDVDRVQIAVPTLLLQGSADQIVSPAITTDLDEQLCSDHVPVTFTEIAGKTHETIVTQTFAQTDAWVEAVVAGHPLTANCS